MRTRNTQQKKVLKHLHYYKNGITSFQAFKLYGITRLSAVIYDLKKNGIEIEMERIPKKNEDGTVTRYGRYFLKPEKK